MNEKEFQEYIRSQIESINTNLNNHVVQLTTDIACIKTDVEWLKEIRLKEIERKNTDNTESRSDIMTQTDMTWVKKLIWLVVASVIGSIGTVIFEIIRLFLSKQL